MRYFPSTLPDVRSDNLHLFDFGLYKNFSMPRNMKLQIRIEVINALNYTVLWNPRNEQNRRDGKQRVVGERRAEPEGIVVPPGPGRGPEESKNRRRAHVLRLFRRALAAAVQL